MDDSAPTIRFDDAQEAFLNDASMATAATYLRTAREYEADDMIGDDTFARALAEIQAWMEQQSTMRLYWVHGDDLNFSRFIAAQSVAEAVRLWQEHHGFNDPEEPHMPSIVAELPPVPAQAGVVSVTWTRFIED